VLERKFTFIVGAAHKASRLPKKSSQKGKKATDNQDCDPDAEPYPEDTSYPEQPDATDILDILAGLNANMENHRKRLKWVEDMSHITSAKIVKAVKQTQQEVA
jgi:hypothetical protein